MSTAVVLSDLFGNTYDALDGSIKSRVMDFVVKLQRDPTAPGLDLKHPAGVEDLRIRTARVNDFWRAVLLQLPETAGFILVAVKPHDDAYTYASKLTFSVNEVTGALEIVNTETLATALERAESTEPSRSIWPESVRRKDLVQLGIQDEIADRLLLVSDEDVLFDLAEALPRSQANAVLDLYSGLGVDEVWSRLVAEEAVGEVDTEDVTAALARPLSRLSFTDLGDDSIDELRAVLEGSLAAWRVWLHPLQRRLATHDGWNGPYRVTGGAGTGKTVTAIHRARHLARRPGSKVLVTTFTRNLAETIKSQLVELAGAGIADNVDVLNVDALASRVLRATDAGRAQAEQRRPVGDDDPEVQSLWATAAGASETQWPAAFLREEWTHVVLAHQVADQSGYLAVSRSGRGQRLSRPQRAELWRIFERFAQLMRAQGLATYTQQVSEAAALLASDEMARRSLGYTTAVVDEAQDLHPAHWRLIRALVPPARDDLFIVGDAHQRIYGKKIPLSRYGIETRGRSKRLTVNYRTSRQILRWCLTVVDADADDLEGATDTLVGARSLFAGPEPSRSHFTNADQERAALVQQLRDWISEGLAASEVAVFLREGRFVTEIVETLKESGLPAMAIDARTGDSADPQAVRVMTMHRAKGLEFRAVALPRLGAADHPPRRVRAMVSDERISTEATERNLLYVAGSRARERLYVSWSGELSPLLQGRTI